MAVRYATKAGVWSDVTVWDGGTTLPGSTDDVYANNFAVSIDQTITVNSLKKISLGSPVIAAGGTFTVTAAATITITAGIAAADNVTNTSSLLQVTSGSFAVTLNANVVGGAGTSRIPVSLSSTYTGTFTINGNVTGGSGSGAHGVSVTATSGILVVNGTVTGAAAASTYGVLVNAASAQLTVNGGVTGGAFAISSGNAFGIYVQAGIVRLDALLQWSALGQPPIMGIFMFKRTGSALAMSAPSDDNWPAATGAAITVERYTTGNPLPANVRSGTTYGPGSTSTGTLAVPPAASVASGVAVDNTTGTAALKLSDVAAVTGDQIAAALA